MIEHSQVPDQKIILFLYFLFLYWKWNTWDLFNQAIFILAISLLDLDATSYMFKQGSKIPCEIAI